MADITDQHDQTSPTELDESHVGNGNQGPAESRGIKRQRASIADDDDDDDEKGGRERRKIEIKFISDKSRRHITFSKRKAGIMKKVCRRFPTYFSKQQQSIALRSLLFASYFFGHRVKRVTALLVLRIEFPTISNRY